MLISFVPKAVATIGYQFTHQGATKICEKCQFIQVCINQLEIGSSYEVVEIKNKEHPCLIDDSIMVVCKVRKINDLLSVQNQKYLENLVLTRKPIDCPEILCDNYDYCVSTKYKQSSKVKIIRKKKNINCPLGYDLVLVEAEKIA